MNVIDMLINYYAAITPLAIVGQRKPTDTQMLVQEERICPNRTVRTAIALVGPSSLKRSPKQQRGSPVPCRAYQHSDQEWATA